MKVKLIINSSELEFQEKINKFIKDKRVIDIKFSEWSTNASSGYSALILYD